MNYTELKTNIEDICENSFTDDQLALFTQQAEQKIYNSVDLPVLRKNATGTLTTSNKYLSTPSDFLSTYSIAVIDGDGVYNYLLNKDVNFIREAYPTPTSTGLPKHYSMFDVDSIIVGPTPDSDYSVEIHYKYYPESIVTAGTTWLGSEFDTALLNGVLVEAIKFLKGEPDVIANYEKHYAQSLALLELQGARLRTDAYRSGQ